MTIEEQIAELKRTMEIRYKLMAGCYDDAAYRFYSADYDKDVKKLIELERQQKGQQNDHYA